MISKLKMIPLGGLGEIGKNMTAFECGNDIIVVDCGMGFPDEEMYGVDIVLPDISYLKNNASRVRGIILTHGHEDHIGAVPYVLRELDVPIYTTPLTAALLELKLEEHDLLYNTQIFTKKTGSSFRLGCFTVEFIRVNHSIPDSVALAIGTPIGTIIHTGDFKIDVTPISGGMIDLTRFGQLGNEGVLAMLSDSTNVEKPGHSDSERKVGESFDKLFMGCNKRIIITTIEKFPYALPKIGAEHKDHRFAIIIDEAHSGQSGRNSAQMNLVLSGLASDDEMDNEDKINAMMEGRKLLNNASYFAFTATPKNKTLETFGEVVCDSYGNPVLDTDGKPKRKPFHVYTMKQAIQEGFILDVLQHYTPIDSFYKLMKTVEDDPMFDKKRAQKKLRSFVEGNEFTIAKKAAMMVEHFHEQVIAKSKIGGQARAMVVTTNIPRCVEYYQTG